VSSASYSQFADAFNVTNIFREAVHEMLPNLISAEKTFTTLLAKYDKPAYKIVTRTKDAMRAKIRLARDFSRCRTAGVIFCHTSQFNCNLTFAKAADCVNVPLVWAESKLLELKYNEPAMNQFTIECSRPVLVHGSYHCYLLMIIELALRTMVTNSANGSSRKRSRTTSAAAAYTHEVQSPLASSATKTASGKRAKPYTARAFLDTVEVDASKLEQLKSTEIAPTFESVCREVCKTYDLLEVAAMRMKAITNVTLQMKMTVSDVIQTVKKAESVGRPKGRRALMSDNYVDRHYFDTKMEQVSEGLRLLSNKANTVNPDAADDGKKNDNGKGSDSDDDLT
jgi:hypothetical protein